MRKSKVETAETHRRIVEVAAGMFRANGIHATGLADIMAAAGLSHGGFYRHFESKDQLVAEACEAGTSGILAALEAAAGERVGADGVRAIVDAYLSPAHRDTAARGCPLAGMGSELARGGPGTRAAASRSADELIALIAGRIGGMGEGDDAQREASRARAVFALSTMIGALTLARIATDPQTSATLLADVRQQLAAIEV
ncbi:TetR/AcrR family transcriptional repressor of nem operon [Paraburkholderia bannensis]|jgi:TetR/AcrR family transcriptional repressor of nem operon|uniref:TetR/AcrR family transcriptional repressor of nem operon n=1 Tax=Paraburkholderia bannensis TaxID=765414 RepID=A0A7W9WUV4_9BURK|nr:MULTISPECIES: TetR family transcriptional regulator [Paraburkholderia]MBB3259158.1 TetR/AcrR family transcriptional repressor of nem operon [Paraburkholderia sp. WP4_3_2]MBB6104173.1 TetR/AcrR family transcriptional repressor of nem operon [Paraburkholderia bannensis]